MLYSGAARSTWREESVQERTGEYGSDLFDVFGELDRLAAYGRPDLLMKSTGEVREQFVPALRLGAAGRYRSRRPSFLINRDRAGKPALCSDQMGHVGVGAA